MSRKRIPPVLRNLFILILVVGLLIGFAVLINRQADPQRELNRAIDYATFSIPDGATPLSGETEVAQTEHLTLTLDPETLGVTVAHSTGSRFTSTAGTEEDNLNTQWRGFLGSGVSIEFYSGDSPQVNRADMFTRTPEKHIYLKDDGFDALINYESLALAFRLEVRLTDDGFTARVPADSIYEGEQFRLGAIYLYPFLGASHSDTTDGYLFIPEGSGALIDFADNEGRFRSPYLKKIYGDDIANLQQITQPTNLPSVTRPQDVTVPVYGVAHTEHALAFLAIAEDGKERSELQAYPSGVVTEYSWAGLRFIYREDAIRQLSRSSGVRQAPVYADLRDIQVRFMILEGEDADYVGMAKAYQGYLKEHGHLTALPEEDALMRVDVLAAESEPWLLSDRVVTLTTVPQLESILTDLNASGATKLRPTYLGWQAGGRSRSYGTFDDRIEGDLGSMRALSELAERLETQGTPLNLHKDLLLANPKGNFDSQTDLVKTESRQTAALNNGYELYPTYYYLTPEASARSAESLVSKVRNDAFGMTISGISDTLFSHYDDGAMRSRGQIAAAHRTIFEDTLERVTLTRPFDYLYAYTEAYYDLPINASNYIYVSREVPFLPMVLKGYLPYFSEYANFEANTEEFTLKLVEYGAYPSFLVTHESAALLKNTNSSDIYTSRYEDFKPIMLEYHDVFSALEARIKGASIVDHERTDTGIVRVTYSNDVRVYVNYSAQAVTADGIEVPARAFEIVG